MPRLNVNSRIHKFSLIGKVEEHDLKLDQAVLAGSNVIFNSLSITDNLTVGGNMIVNGALTVLSTDTLEILDNIIEINRGETGSGVTLGISGLEVNRGLLTNQQIIYQESTDTWRSGEDSTTQSLTNREDSPLINGIMTWNDTDKRVDSSNQINIDIIFAGNNSSSKSSGGIRLTGGIGIEEDAYIGGILYFEGTSPTHATITSNAANNLNINSSADINLTAVGNINIPMNIGLTFSSETQKIESNGTDLTINSGGILSLNSTGSFTLESGGPSEYTTTVGNITIDSQAGELILDGNSGIDIDSNGDIRIDTTSMIYIGTEVSGVPISIGNTISETTIGDNLTIQGDLIITGTSSHEAVVSIDTTSTEAFLVRKDSDSGDIFTVNTSDSKVLINGINITPSNGEISEISYSSINNTSVPTNITGFAFSEGTVRSFKAIVSICIIATVNLYEQIEVRGLHMEPGTWILTESKIGDDTNVDLSIISSGGKGQIQYTSTNISGFISSTIKIVSKEVTTM